MKIFNRSKEKKQTYSEMIEEAKTVEYSDQPADRKAVLRSNLLLYGLILGVLVAAAILVRVFGQ